MADKIIIERLTKAWMPWLFTTESPLSEIEQSTMIKRVEMIVDAYQKETARKNNLNEKEE